MPHVHLDGARMRTWDAFHDHCADVLGFPTFYGRNMHAWIDCLTYVREGDGMSRFELGPDEALVFEVLGAEEFNRRAPEIFDALVECAAFVNRRQVDAGERPALQFLFR